MTEERATRRFRPWWPILLLIPGGIGVALAEVAVWVSPSSFPLLALFGMAFPFSSAVLLLGTVGAVWARRWKAVLVGALLIAGAWSHVEATWGTWSAPPEDGAARNTLKVLTWNVRQFNRYGWIERSDVRDSILSYLAAQDADVICLQECFLEDRRQPWMSEARLKQATGLNHWQEEFKLGRGQDKLFGLAILSRYPLANKSAIRFANDKNNSAMHVDVLVNGDTVRVYNMHLSSIGFEKEDYEDARNVQDEEARQRLFQRLATAWSKRAEQAEEVASSVAATELPVIAVGDFNDTPVSYAAGRFGRHLRDAYRSASMWSDPAFGATYIGDLPMLRIDQMWASPELHVSGHTTGGVEWSDHRPVHATFGWEE